MSTPAEILAAGGLTNADLIVQAASERWAFVPGYEGRYEISDRGSVRSLDRIDAGGRCYKGKPIAGSTDKDGYRQVGLRTSDGTRKTWKVHALVLLAFVGPRPKGYFACHNNGDNTDNRLSNLRWDTAVANAADAIAHGTQTNIRKTHCPRGHRLVAPNLVHVYEVAGTRWCRACCNALGYVRHHPELDAQKLSDAYYAEIMSGSQTTNRRKCDWLSDPSLRREAMAS